MKKKIYFLWSLTIGLLFLFAGCMSFDKEVQGKIVLSGEGFFGVEDEQGKIHGFVISDKTRLVWKENILEKCGGTLENQWEIFGPEMYVSIREGSKVDSPSEKMDEEVECWMQAKEITVTEVSEAYFATAKKPVIYLYPEKEMMVDLSLDIEGDLSCTYPFYQQGWKVTAMPDGTLRDLHGKFYNYLYWEAVLNVNYDFSKGFCVAGKDTASFLEDSLDRLGLSRREANEFIVYWLPKMQNNPYNLIAFQGEAYTEKAKLRVSPEPDTLIRIFMAWKPLKQPIMIENQILSAKERKGFTLVEWGGAEVEGGR